jgi:AhpD family alkylhydroperoxidase
LLAHLRDAPGHLTPTVRRAVFDNDEVPADLAPFVDAVVRYAHPVTDGDVAALVRRMARAEVPEVIKMAAYRHRYFGTPFHVLVQDLMRGPSSWTVGERELFAAFTSSRNQCQFCTTAHQAFAASCAGDDVVAAALAAPIRPQVTAVLTFLDTLAGSPERRPCASAPCSTSSTGSWTRPGPAPRRTLSGPRPRIVMGGATSCRRPSAGSPVAIEPASENGTKASAGLATLRQSCGNPTAPSSLAARPGARPGRLGHPAVRVTAPPWRGSPPRPPGHQLGR